MASGPLGERLRCRRPLRERAVEAQALADHGEPAASVAARSVDGLPVDVRGAKRRAVLALAEGRTVPVDQLVDALWPGEVPESGRQALHSHVVRLRGHLGPAADRLRTLQDGYWLELGGDGLDAARARALLAAGRSAVEGEPARALALLREADALWRGPVLADLTDVGPIAAAVTGLARLRHDVAAALVASGIAAGQAR